MPLITDDDQTLRALLSQARVIAVVGHSDNPTRTSYQIAQYLRAVGYTVLPVNPTIATIDGQRSYPSLAAINQPIDIVNVFRRSEYLLDVIDESIAIGAKAVWAQLGVYDWRAQTKVAAHPMQLVMDSCIKVEHARLGIPPISRGDESRQPMLS